MNLEETGSELFILRLASSLLNKEHEHLQDFLDENLSIFFKYLDKEYPNIKLTYSELLANSAAIVRQTLHGLSNKGLIYPEGSDENLTDGKAITFTLEGLAWFNERKHLLDANKSKRAKRDGQGASSII